MVQSRVGIMTSVWLMRVGHARSSLMQTDLYKTKMVDATQRKSSIAREPAAPRRFDVPAEVLIRVVSSVPHVEECAWRAVPYFVQYLEPWVFDQGLATGELAPPYSTILGTLVELANKSGSLGRLGS
jgi:hypothetical protein